MKITKSQLKQIIKEELLILELFGTASAEADKAGNCAAKGGTWDEEQGKCVFGEKNDPKDIDANLRRADAARRAAKEKAKKDKKGIQKEDATGEVDKTPYMDMTKYELNDLSTDRQMVVLLKEVVAQLKTLVQHMTPAKGMAASEIEKSLAQTSVAEGAAHPGSCEQAHPDQSHEEWEEDTG